MPNPNFATASSQKTTFIWDDDTTLCDEGGYFIATNPTVGTGIAATICVDDAATASSTHAQFAPTLLIYNQQSAQNPNAISLYLRYLKLICTVAPASATAWKYSLRMDNLNRYSSGGSVITPVNPNPGSVKTTSVALCYFGAIVPTALPSANARLVANGTLDTAIPVVGDQYLFHFGAPAISMDQLNGGTTAKNMTMLAPPVIIPAGWCLALDMWGASNAATPASWEFEMGYAERSPGQ
jgi:hypothetical protein